MIEDDPASGKKVESDGNVWREKSVSKLGNVHLLDINTNLIMNESIRCIKENDSGEIRIGIIEDEGLPINTKGLQKAKQAGNNILGKNLVRLLSYNIFMRPPGIKNNKSDFKDKRLVDFIDILFKYDVVCLQEMFDTLNYRKIKMKIEAYRVGFEHSAESDQMSIFSKYAIDGGLLTLSRYPIIKKKFRSFSKGCEIDKAVDKGVLYTKIKAHSSRSIHIFNTHLQASYDKHYSEKTKNSFLVRFSQLIDMRNYIIEWLKESPPSGEDVILICGDLNIDFYGDPLDIDIYKKEFPQDLGFITGIEQLNEYNLAKKMIESKGFIKLEDLIDQSPTIATGPPKSLISSSSFSNRVYTYADYYIDDKQKKVPFETVLTTKDDLLSAMRLDYMLRVHIVDGKEGGERMSDDGLFEHRCVVDPMVIEGRPYTHLSDHYAVYLDFSL